MRFTAKNARVFKIQEFTPAFMTRWTHVPTDDIWHK